MAEICDWAETKARRLDDEPVYLFVAIQGNCRLTEEEAGATAEAEFLRGRLKTVRKWVTGDFETLVNVECWTEEGSEQVLRYYGTAENNIMHGRWRSVELRLWESARTGRMPVTRGADRVKEAVGKLTAQAVTAWLKMQERARAGRWCRIPDRTGVE